MSANKRWDRNLATYVDAPDVDAFLSEIIAVCRKHNMVLEHEDSQGGFLVYREFKDGDGDHLMGASISGTQEPKP